MEKTVQLINHLDLYTGLIYGQEVKDKDKIIPSYWVYNLSECPEDAVIYRDLVSAQEYINILNTGIELAKMGIDKVIYEETEVVDN